jgi:hypothetical protein
VLLYTASGFVFLARFGPRIGQRCPVNVPLFQLFRRGLIAWQEDFADREKALEAAGLRE